ncbi:3-methyladenine DNA glycosylase [Tersicoccus sp. Bi-70]|uniref:3-methyladenine DNA glycosylase n=1 Tax=Tersicoccus sp. Bi-70 TaxID=1897634 RepID=UPI0009758442|nr:3-methyladenine DNA glycosylase [Tersicoccus sp. Bi-70]OMH32281.1 3-methyladenine DNA glycosylase [Tersicoccus sp. Bi-70]
MRVTGPVQEPGLAGVPLVVVPADDASDRAGRHLAHAARFTEPFRARRSAGIEHPVEDFLFTYYALSPGKLARWHPGAGAVLTGAAAEERAGWKDYRALDATERAALGLATDDPAVTADAGGFLARRSATVAFVRRLLGATASRPGQFGCFGLHEWAMVYRQGADERRHEALPLRLSAEQTDAVVEGHRIRCSHIDAFRFFTPEATGRNELQPTRHTQPDLEQPGCLHATMDLYKWAFTLLPLVPSELVLTALDLAADVREVDMRASPYDLAGHGLTPIRIETPAGKAEYVAAQRSFAERGADLRRRLLAELERVDARAR